jgi:hypothetical protein
MLVEGGRAIEQYIDPCDLPARPRQDSSSRFAREVAIG